MKDWTLTFKKIYIYAYYIITDNSTLENVSPFLELVKILNHALKVL